MSASEGEPATGGRSAAVWLRLTARRRALAEAWKLPAAGEALGRVSSLDWREWLDGEIETERSARTGFYLAPMAMMLGILLVHGAGMRWPIALALGGAAVLFLAGAWRDGGALRCVCLAAGFTLFGIGLAQIELHRTDTTIFSGEATVRIEGPVVWRDQDERGRYRYRVRITGTERPALSRPPGEARIVVSSRHEPIPVGGLYKGLVRLRPPSGPSYPGAYDFAFGPYFDGLGAYGFGLGAPDPAVGASTSADPPSVEMRITELRLAISDRIRSVIGGAEGAVAAALITGERSGIPEEINVWLRSTGLSHVLSISGMHMALVAGFAMLAARAVLAAIPSVALTHPTKKWAAGFALLISTLYLVISGDNVATERSYIMLAIMLVAVFFDRPALTLRNVAIAAVVVIVMTPHAVMTASFQMSFAATAALVGAYGGYARWQARRGGSGFAGTRGPVMIAVLFLGGLAASSLIAGTATGPYAAYHFHRMAPFGLVANVVALPIFSLWIMPLALLSMLAMPLGLDAPLLWLMGHGLTLVFEIARLIHGVLPDRPTGRLTGEGVLVLTVALLAAAFLASRLRWIALPLAAIGLVLAPDRSPYPELLIFEDGKEIALTDAGGRLVYRRDKPNGFVSEQWERAFVTEEPEEAAGTALAESSLGFRCDEEAVCRATSRTGLRIVWTDDYEKTGLACDEADIAIVARAMRLKSCRSGAILVTLRTLRESGSLAISRSPETGHALATASIENPPSEWNRHRFEPWPEYWRQPETEATAADATKGEAGKPLGK